jgi:hypothetical protein
MPLRPQDSVLAENAESGRAPEPSSPIDLPPEAIDDIVRQMEERWLSDSIPALSDDDRLTVQVAMADTVTRDFALFEGELAEWFADTFDQLLPSDERELLRSWCEAPRRLLEVLDVRPMRGALTRDLLTGEEIEVSDRRMTTQIKVKDLIYGRPLPDGEGALRFQSDPLEIPRLMRGPLLRLLREDASPEEILDLLSPNRAMPEVRRRMVKNSSPARRGMTSTLSTRSGNAWLTYFARSEKTS